MPRPTKLDADKSIRETVYLTPADHAALLVMGQGSITQGIRAAMMGRLPADAQAAAARAAADRPYTPVKGLNGMCPRCTRIGKATCDECRKKVAKR